jgi:SPP1 family holin
MNKVTLIKMIVLVVVLINNSLAIAGKSPLPFDDAQVESFVSTVFTITGILIAWFHNNFDKKK